MGQYPNDINPDFPVATVYARSGEPVDYLAHWQTVVSYAAQGYRVTVHAGDGRYSKEELQAAADREFTESGLRK
ncbi:hypothetical protein MA5S0422_2975 [Mycobacteroides abscessus 5S-0422]|uniref:Uncharacterized protein n=1 Tax=Mycobacteroides abscessus subsp. bolletii 1513 TaxID=1299321 RepID=X8DQZ1_9MYCO|nr:hypothetical protein [Mycobacteroides abscessus]EUA70784.1 hypothetical protein I540_3206 [Mycobacteroides abscessus subsp. bolletii 1513]EIU11564.1 hypothetical protein MA5S0304_2040 [Mycobacteroides abscessus 5S-0304]EIU12739.1 hypothetical protein MA5S0421_2293 [Mycobacteroides abscessus 5S-0421]EIU13124.1 hypothetical protein MA5S0422_2975 [Mycobacteroides abscessus 5S-0422]EIU20348.1 hypothetical protein MA5S0708_5062 [Mycobacteroides abscessus 5S-0708]